MPPGQIFRTCDLYLRLCDGWPSLFRHGPVADGREGGQMKGNETQSTQTCMFDAKQTPITECGPGHQAWRGAGSLIQQGSRNQQARNQRTREPESQNNQEPVSSSACLFSASWPPHQQMQHSRSSPRPVRCLANYCNLRSTLHYCMKRDRVRARARPPYLASELRR